MTKTQSTKTQSTLSAPEVGQTLDTPIDVEEKCSKHIHVLDVENNIFLAINIKDSPPNNNVLVY